MSAFKSAKKKIWLHCTADIPTDKIKDNIDHYQIQVKKMKPDEYEDMVYRIQKLKQSTWEQELKLRMCDWKIKGQEDQDIDYNEENIEDFFNQQPYVFGYQEAFIQLHIGKQTFKRLREKN